jgi:hypothetical protein
MLVAILVSALVSSALTAIAMYVSFIRPNAFYTSCLDRSVKELTSKLQQEENLLSDITEYIKVETYRYPAIRMAIEQRIKERLREVR